jgi:hypothetical protein
MSRVFAAAVHQEVDNPQPTARPLVTSFEVNGAA